MSIKAGFSRINLLIRWAAYLLLGGGVLSLLAAWADSASSQGWLIAASMLGVVGAAAYAISWIVAGFLGEPEAATPPRLAPSQVSWLRWAIVLGALVVGSFIVYREDGDVARYIGGVLMLLLLVAAVSAAARRGRPPGIVGAMFFAVLAVGYSVKNHIEAKQKREEALAAMSAMRVAQESRLTGAPVAGAVPMPANTPSISPFIRLSAFIRQSAAEATSNEQRYLRATEEANPELWLANEALLNKSVRARMRPQIQRLTTARETYEREALGLLQRMRQFAEAAIAEGGEAAKMGRGMLETLPRSEALTKKFVATDRQFVGQVVALYDFLDDPSLRHTTTADQILFERDADLKRYQAHFAEIQRLAGVSEALTAEARSVHQAGQAKLKAAEQYLSQPVSGRSPPR